MGGPTGRTQGWRLSAQHRESRLLLNEGRVATSEQALQMTDRLYAALIKRRPKIKKRYDYLNGEQPLVYATEEWKTFHKERFKGFSDNWCEVVALAPVDRLRIIGLRISGSTDVITDDERQLWEDR